MTFAVRPDPTSLAPARSSRCGTGRGVLTGWGAAWASRCALFIAKKSEGSCEQMSCDLAGGRACELTQARLIGAPLRAVELHQRLEKTHALRRGAGVRLDFGVMEISVAAMEQPIVRAPDRDAAMPARMAGKRTSSNSSRVPGIARTAEKPNQDFALFLDRLPFLDRGDLRLAIAVSLAKRRPMRGRAKFGGENMDCSVGEIAHPSGMVEVEMGRHDVANVAGAVAHIHDLPERRLRDVEPWPHHRVEQEIRAAAAR